MLGLSNNRPEVRLEVLRLIDQHDGDVVFDGVDQAAGVTHQRFGGRRAVLEWAFALGADENLEQVGRETHPAYPSRFRDASWRRHLGSTFACSSRNTRAPSSTSIFPRAVCPIALMVRPPSPITIPFWLARSRSEEHTSELQSRLHLVCRLLLEKK